MKTFKVTICTDEVLLVPADSFEVMPNGTLVLYEHMSLAIKVERRALAHGFWANVVDTDYGEGRGE